MKELHNRESDSTVFIASTSFRFKFKRIYCLPNVQTFISISFMTNKPLLAFLVFILCISFISYAVNDYKYTEIQMRKMQ